MTARRPLALAVAGLLHAGLIALLLTGHVGALPAPPPGAIAVRAVPAPPAAPTPAFVAPALPAIAVDLAPPPVEIADRPAGDACPLLGAIGAALASDPGVGAALATDPTTALMLWDGAWSSDPAAAPIRRVVVDRIRASDPSCRATELTGPRLVIVPNGTRTVTIAIGSGAWNWQQLLS